MGSTLFKSIISWFIVTIIMIAIVSVTSNVTATPIVTGETYLSSKQQVSIMVCDDRYLWMGTGNKGLLRMDKNAATTTLFTSSNSGLPNDNVHALTTDSAGALLVGTAHQGIVRFDGTRWEQLPALPEKNAIDIAVDARGSVWTYTSGGLLVLENGSWCTVINRVAGELTTDPAGNIWMYHRENPPNSPDGPGTIYECRNGGLQATISLAQTNMTYAYPYPFTVDDKNCWIGARYKLIRINDASLDTFHLCNTEDIDRSVTALATGVDGSLLTAVTEYGVGTTIYVASQDRSAGKPLDSAVAFIPKLPVYEACSDPQGGFWCATSDGTIIRINATNQMSILTTGNSVLPDNAIASLLVDKANNVWVATGNGIVMFDGTVWSLYPAEGDTLSGPEATALALDSTGILWAGFSQAPVSSVVESGISLFEEEHWRRLTVDHFGVRFLTVDASGDQWAICDDGLYRYHEMEKTLLFERKYSSVKEIALGTEVNTVAFDASQTPWIGTGLGLKKYEDGVWVDDTTLSRVLPADRSVNTIVFDPCNGTSWVAYSGGLLRSISGHHHLFDTTGGMHPFNAVQCIVPTGPQSAWLGTAHGLVYLDGSTPTLYHTGNSPLFDNNITAVAVTARGDIWVGTGRGGITRIDSVTTTPIAHRHGAETSQNNKTVQCSFTPLAYGGYCINVVTAEPQTLSLSIMTLDGKCVQQVNNTAVKHSCSLHWNGTDRYHRAVPSGVYLAVVTGNNRIISAEKITVGIDRR